WPDPYRPRPDARLATGLQACDRYHWFFPGDDPAVTSLYFCGDQGEAVIEGADPVPPGAHRAQREAFLYLQVPLHVPGCGEERSGAVEHGRSPDHEMGEGDA